MHDGHAILDAADWTVACTHKTAVDDLEPLPENDSAYRQVALQYLAKLLAIDHWLSSAQDARLAWISVAIVLKLSSVQGLSELEIAGQLGVPIERLARSRARFAALIRKIQ